MCCFNHKDIYCHFSVVCPSNTDSTTVGIYCVLTFCLSYNVLLWLFAVTDTTGIKLDCTCANGYDSNIVIMTTI